MTGPGICDGTLPFIHAFTHYSHSHSLTQSLSAHSLCTDRVSCLWAECVDGAAAAQEGWDGPARGWAGNKAEKERGSVCMVECMPWPEHPLRDACYSLQMSTKPLCSSPCTRVAMATTSEQESKERLHASLLTP